MREYQFQKALPIWAAGREREKNCELACRVILPSAANMGKTILALAASSIYRVRVNGSFLAAGPARAAHGFYRVDELDLTEMLTKEANVVVIDVVGYNVNSFDTLDQPAFLQAEVRQGGEVLAWTGDEMMRMYELHQRVQRVERYSFQRAFVDCYRLQAAKQCFYTDTETAAAEGNTYWESIGIQAQTVQIQPEKCCIEREVGMPPFQVLPIQKHLESGTADYTYQCPNLVLDRPYTNISEKLMGYPREEQEEHLTEEAQNIAWTKTWTAEEDQTADAGAETGKADGQGDTAQAAFKPQPLENGYALYCFPFNATGLLHLQVACEEDCVVYAIFDEVLCDGRVNIIRLNTCNCFKYRLDAGKHDILTFAPYTMKYIQVAAKGKCTLLNLDMIEYKHPAVAYEVQLPDQEPQDQVLKKIYQAALETYLANAADVFMDCPSRERAGWLCDSFFTSRVEHVLTGESKVERAFLENFLIAREFKCLPKGMLPMCYPSDHYDGNFIPNWAMWFVLELEEYYSRSGDDELIQQARERVYDLLDYFKPFENQYGLLERLEAWVFVEWSRANDGDVVQDVNFPTNMLYARMLQSVAVLYHDEALLEKAAQLKKVIRERSKGELFFTDNERITPEGYTNPGNQTEVCQYYAFFTGIATREEDSELWETLIRDFGPQRKETKLHPEVAFANAFIGNYLRIELLYRNGQYDQVLGNILGYFAKMADSTGTLWEHDRTVASCNHGFASHVIYWLAGIYGVKAV